jgi:tetratricopeptide (TPR) repeat protein
MQWSTLKPYLSAPSGPIDDMAALSVLSRCADSCAALEDTERAAVLYERLTPYADRWVVSAGAVCTGTVHIRLGSLAATLGRLEEAASHLEAALAAHRAAGAPPLIALAELELARVVGALGRPERAGELLGHAERTARALGMEPLVERIEQVAPARGTTPAAQARLVLEGEYWVAEPAGHAVRLRDRKGIGYLARLVERPHRDLSALELSGAGEAAPRGDAGELLDDEAKRAYRRRVEDLREEIDEAERWNDPERAERATAELDFVTAELARHLAASVRTGAYCRYAPEAGEEVTWRVERG